MLRLGRRGETVTPLHWSDPSHRSMGHLVPDVVVTRPASVWIVGCEVPSPTWRRSTKAAGASCLMTSVRATAGTFIKSSLTAHCSTHQKLRRHSHTRSDTRHGYGCTSEAWTGRLPTSTTELDTCGWSCGDCRSAALREAKWSQQTRHGRVGSPSCRRSLASDPGPCDLGVPRRFAAPRWRRRRLPTMAASPPSRLIGAVVALSATASLLTSAQSRQAASPTATPIDFNRQIRPLLSDRCFRCHGPDSAKRKAKLRLDMREGAFKEAERGLGDRQAGRSGEERAHPPHHQRRHRRDDAAAGVAPVADRGREGAAEALGGGRRGLPAALVVAPVAAGRRCRRFETAAPTNPIDAFVRARLDQEGLVAGAARVAETLIRRLAFEPHRPAADAGRDRRLPRRPLAPAPTSASSTATSPRPPTASAWRWTGSIWRATPTPTATRPTSNATCRPAATG